MERCVDGMGGGEGVRTWISSFFKKKSNKKNLNFCLEHKLVPLKQKCHQLYILRIQSIKGLEGDKR